MKTGARAPLAHAGWFLLLSLFSTLVSATIPLFQEVFVESKIEGVVTHNVLASDGTAIIAGVAKYDFESEEPISDPSIFYGLFASNTFIWARTVMNFGGDSPKVHDLVPSDSGFLLIGSFSNTLIFDEEHYIEPTGQPISIFVASFNFHGGCLWVNSIGVDWETKFGPLAITGARGYGDEFILVGNYLKNVNMEEGGSNNDDESDDFQGEEEVPKGADTRGQTFFVVLNHEGDDVSIYYAAHVWNDECENNPCQNGGTCEINYFKYGVFCECPDGFRGERCELVDDGTAPKDNEDDEYDNGEFTFDDDEEWNDLPDDDFMGRRKRSDTAQDNAGPKLVGKKRSAFTQTESVEEGPGGHGNVLSCVGYNYQSEYSVFYSRFSVSEDDVDLLWDLEFDVGKAITFPSLETFLIGSKAYVALAGTFSKSSEIAGKPLPFSSTSSRDIFVTLLNDLGEVVWVQTVSGVGKFHDQSSFYIPITVNCSSYFTLAEAMAEEACSIIIAGPSSNTTKSGGLLIDEYDSHQSFLASFSLGSGKPMWIKELFPDAKFGEIRSLEMSETGNVWAGGSVSGSLLHFDWEQSASNPDSPSLLIAKVGFFEEKTPLYQKYIAPIRYSSKTIPRVFMMIYICSFIGAFAFLISRFKLLTRW